MKRIFIVIVMVGLIIDSIYAKKLTDYTENVKGPVKTMTVTSEQGSIRVWKYWYDSIGRLNEFAYYDYVKLEQGFVRQYTINNVYIDYNYDKNGIIKGSFKQTQLDSLGNKICVKYYVDGKLSSTDSIVYNAHGKEIESYNIREGRCNLRHRCEYDSLDRLTLWSNDVRERTYEYLSDGNYIEHELSTKHGKRPDKKYIYNEQGQLIKIKGKEEHSRFLKFDKYGNWTVWEEVEDIPIGHFEFTYKREIEYYD